MHHLLLRLYIRWASMPFLARLAIVWAGTALALFGVSLITYLTT